MESDYVDFKEVKRSVSLEMLLAHYNVRLRRVNADTLRGACPLPTHSSKGEQSFTANVAKGAWSCLSASCVKARGGRRGGNILDFTSVMEGGCSIREAALKLKNLFGVGSVGGEAPRGKEVQPSAAEQLVAKRRGRAGEVTDDISPDAENKPLGFALRNIDHSHPYLTARRITPQTAAHFGVGFFSGRGSMSGRLVIPIHNPRGELVAYAGRSIDTTEPKYRLPGGFHKSHELWNLHRVLALTPKPKQVIVVEGFFDAMRVHQAGLPHVVALMGCTISHHQTELLVSHFKAIVLALDGDEAGKRAADEMAPQLARRMFVRIAPLADGKQPDELSDDELTTLLGSL